MGRFQLTKIQKQFETSVAAIKKEQRKSGRTKKEEAPPGGLCRCVA
jgi:hypothetical protein